MQHYIALVKIRNIEQPCIIKSATCESMEQFWEYCKRFALVKSNLVTVSQVK